MRRHVPDLVSLLLGLAFTSAAVLVALDLRLPLWLGADSPGPILVGTVLVVLVVLLLQWWLHRRARRAPDSGE